MIVNLLKQNISMYMYEITFCDFNIFFTTLLKIDIKMLELLLGFLINV